MVGRRIRLVQPLNGESRAAAFAAALLLAGCQPVSARPSLPVPDAAVVELGSQAAAAQLRDGRVSVVVAVPAKREGGGGSASVITSSAAAPGGTVNLLSYGGATGEPWNTFVYGNAPPGIARVELSSSAGVGGQVVDGAWLIALPDLDVTPDQVHWRFLGLDGTVLRAGDGIVTAP